MTAPLAGSVAERTDTATDIRVATVLAVTTRGLTLSVTDGVVYDAAHLGSYAPAVGDSVACLRVRDSWLVLGRPLGPGTAADNATPGTVFGLGVLGGMHTTGSDTTLASSSGSEVTVPGYSVTVHHPTDHSLLLVAGFSWYSSQNADWIAVRLREQSTAAEVGLWTEPQVSNAFGRVAMISTLVPMSYGGQARSYYMTVQRLTGTGATRIDRVGVRPGFLFAIDLGDKSMVVPT